MLTPETDGRAGESVRVGVVGCGFQGRLHLECLLGMDGVEVVAVCDRDEDRARAAASEFDVPAFCSHHSTLLERHSIDLLTICTMPDSHCEIAVDALTVGVDVLCEKPMAPNLEDALAMVAAARKTDHLLSVGFNLRFTSAAQAVRGFVDEGRLGVPVCARGSMLETEIPWWGPHQVKKISGGGAVAATAVHMIDLLMWLAGNPKPLTATASMARLFPQKRGQLVPDLWKADRYDVEDLAFGHVRFESGFWMSIEGSWTWDEPGWECRFDLVGDRAQASAVPLRFWTEQSGRLVELTNAATGQLDFADSLSLELADMVAASRDRRAPLVTAEQGLEVQAVVDALYRSAAQGREVTVAEVRAPVSTSDRDDFGRS